MKKYKILLLIITMFIFSKTVNAECSYQERKELLNLTKNVTIKFNAMTEKKKELLQNPNNGEMEEVELIKDYLELNISGLKDGYFLIITDNSIGEEKTIDNTISNNGSYTIRVDNVSSIVTYSIDFYSNHPNCFADKITTKKIKKPKKNYFYNYDICNHEDVIDSKYCKKYITSDFTVSEDEIFAILNSRIKSNDNSNKENEKLNLIELVKEFWYIPTIIILIAITIFVILKIRKKRGEL